MTVRRSAGLLVAALATAACTTPGRVASPKPTPCVIAPSVVQTISLTQFDPLHIALFAGHLAFTASTPGDTHNPQNNQAYVEDLATRKLSLLGTSSQYYGQIPWIEGDGHYAVYVYEDGVQQESAPYMAWDMWAVDLDTGVHRLLASTHGKKQTLMPQPHVRDGLAAWLQQTDDLGRHDEVVVAHLDTGVTRVLAPTADPGYLAVEDAHTVVFSSAQADPPGDRTHQDAAADAYAVDVDTGHQTRLTRDGRVSAPRVGGRFVVWEYNDEGETGSHARLLDQPLAGGPERALADAPSITHLVTTDALAAWLDNGQLTLAPLDGCSPARTVRPATSDFATLATDPASGDIASLAYDGDKATVEILRP